MHTKHSLEPPYDSALLADDAWLRAVIGQLVRIDRVDDVLQDTWLAALEQGRESGGTLRGWLVTVARRLAFRTHRAEERRARRERGAARDTEEPSVDEIVQRVELRQRVTAAVLALGEPFRSTLLQRFYENRTPQQIARLHRVPPATVRTRLHRALRMLRASLRTRDADRRSILITGAAVPRAGKLTWRLLAMTTKLRLSAAVAALLLVCGLAVLWWTADPPSVPPGGATAGAAVEPRSAPDVSSAAGSMRTEVAIPRVDGSPVDETGNPTGVLVRGRVLDPEGGAVADAAIYRRPNLDESAPGRLADRTRFAEVSGDWTPVGRSETDGSFAVRVEDIGGWLAVGPPFFTVRPWDLGARPDEAVVVACPAVSLSGLVTRPDHTPLPDVQISGFCERLPGFPLELDHNGRPRFPGGRTDAEGRFHLARVPACPAVVYTFSSPGYRDGDLAAPTMDGEHRHVVLEPLAGSGGPEIVGRVYDPQGVAVAGALVGLGEARTTSDDHGAYRLAIPDHTQEEVLFAWSPGYLPACEPHIDPLLEPPHPKVLDLFLRPATGAISGRVYGPDGRPWKGVQVYPWDLAYLGSSPMTAEGFEVGADDEWIGNSTTADEDGAFELTGLDDRPYRLRFLDRSMPFGFTSDPIPAGSRDVEIRVPADALREMVTGLVVDGLGRGIGDVRLEYRVPIRMRSGSGVFTTGGGTATDASGAFTLRNVPREDALLLVHGDGIVPTEHFLATDAPSSGLQITTHRRCRFRVYAPQAPEGAGFEVLDAEGKPLTVIQFTGQGRIFDNHWKLTGGRTEILTVSDAARVIVLRHADMEIGRQALVLGPDGVTAIRF